MASDSSDKSSIWDDIVDLFSPDKPNVDPDLATELDDARAKRIENIPTIWLLGKTGAGKSSFVKSLTQFLDVQIGNGFKPCTQTTDEYLYPADEPIIRILDTRGLGEAGYNHSEDLNDIALRADMVIVLAKVDEPDQSDILEALKSLKSSDIHSDLLVLHTAAKSIDSKDTDRLIALNKESFDRTWKKNITHIEVDFSEEEYGLDLVLEALSDLLPVVKLKLDLNQVSSEESNNFGHLQTMVYSYSGTAAIAAAVPTAGPTLAMITQGKMMADIAEHMEMEWDRNSLLTFLGALGTSFVVQQLAIYGVRTLISVIPWVGSAVNATLTFGTTYAFGRATAYYLYKEKSGEQVSTEELRSIYMSAFERGKQVET